MCGFTLGAVLVRLGVLLASFLPPRAGPRDTCVAEKLEQGIGPTGASGEGRVLSLVLEKKCMWNYSFISYKQICVSLKVFC